MKDIRSHSYKEHVLRSKKEVEPPSVQYYPRLISEMDSIGWDKLISIDNSLTTLQIRLM